MRIMSDMILALTRYNRGSESDWASTGNWEIGKLLLSTKSGLAYDKATPKKRTRLPILSLSMTLSAVTPIGPKDNKVADSSRNSTSQPGL